MRIEVDHDVCMCLSQRSKESVKDVSIYIQADPAGSKPSPSQRAPESPLACLKRRKRKMRGDELPSLARALFIIMWKGVHFIR